MKTSKAILVKHSPLYEEQLKRLREAIKEKDSKFHRQLLKAIEREEDNLRIDMHRGTQIEKGKIPKEYISRILRLIIDQIRSYGHSKKE